MRTWATHDRHIGCYRRPACPLPAPSCAFPPSPSGSSPVFIAYFHCVFLGTYSLLLAHFRPFLPALFSCSPCISALSDKFFSVTACCHRGADGGRDICHEKAGKKKIKQKQNRDNRSLGNQDYPHQLLGG